MKKFFGITMAAVCALTVAAFGISACGDDETASDEVTEEEWIAAMDATNAYNVTVNAAGGYTYKTTYSDGTVETETGSATLEAKVAFTATETSGYVTGNAYLHNSNSYNYTSTDEEDEDYSYTSETTEYEVFTEESYSCVEKRTYSDEEDEYWYGWMSSVQSPVDWSDGYEAGYAFGELGGEDVFSYFEYSDGAYKCTLTEEDGDTLYYEVKINNGYVTYLLIEYVEEYAYSGNNEVYTEWYEYNFSNYGTTTVEVPEEYTYAYYLANNAD